MRKKWTKPCVTVVTKSTAEENVLWACKGAYGDSTIGGGPAVGLCGQYNVEPYSHCNPQNPS